MMQHRKREALGLWIGMAVLATTLGAQPTTPPAAEEDAGPVRIETLEIEPTVAKTGDLIHQTYRVRFPDLIDQGREIVMLEDRMTPENLPVHPFEGVSLDVEKRRVDDEHVWDFRYGFRLIAPEKALYVLPAFSFYYLVRDLGEDIEDAEVQQVDGGAALIRYVTTITDVPVLDIRDTIELGSFQGRATLFRSVAWGVAPLPLFVWLVLLVRHVRRPRMFSEERQEEEDELARIEAEIPVPPSVWQARRTLVACLPGLEALAPSAKKEALAGLQRDLVIAIREYLKAELPELHLGDTPKDILGYIEGMKAGSRREALQELASRLVSFQGGLERAEPVPIADPRGEARALGRALSRLRPHNRMLGGLGRLFGAR